MNGKIARLPSDIREQLNVRLNNGEHGRGLLPWLNSLPEVQSLLAAQFNAQPITKQNLYEWSQHGFRAWRMRQTALEFAAANDDSDPALPKSLADTLAEKLVQWLTVRYAAAAQALAPTDDDPDTELRRLRSLSADIFALRRGDLKARRLALDHRRLTLEEANAAALKEDEFWNWIKRPDIQEKLKEQRRQDRLRRESLIADIPELAPFLPPEEPDETDETDEVETSEIDETTDPAILI